MTTKFAPWLNRLVILLLWLGLTAGVAFLVARNAAGDDSTQDVTAPLPPIAAEERSTVSLTEQTIAPVVSADGSVTHDADDDRWLLVAPAQPADLAYRLLDEPIGVKALIDGGPTGFDCAWAGLAPAAGGGEVAMSGKAVLAEDAASVTMRCEIPDDIRVVAGMTGTMVLALEEPSTAQALPLSAVVGTAGQGQVVIVHDDGGTEVRPVTLGRSDTFWIEVTDGLEPDEQVLEVPTQADLSTEAP